MFAVKSVPSTTATPLRVTCMANPRRVAKVQQQMRREISNMLQMDKVLRVEHVDLTFSESQKKSAQQPKP